MLTERDTYVYPVNRSRGWAASVVGQPRPNFGTLCALEKRGSSRA
jgi:hypothetical protein